MNGIQNIGPLSDNTVRSIIQNKHGIMFFATNKGLHRFDGTKVYNYEHIPEMRLLSIKVLYEDSDGLLWLGTDAKGLYSFDLKKEVLTHIPFRKDGKQAIGVSILSIYKSSSGVLWVGTFDQGLLCLKPQAYELTQQHKYSSDGGVYALLEDRSKRIWLGTEYSGLKLLNQDGEIEDIYTMDKGLPSNLIRSLYEDRSGNVIVGTMSGISVLHHGSTLFQIPKNNPHVLVSDIGETYSGELWLGSLGNGLYKYDIYRNNIVKERSVSSKLSDKTVTAVYGSTEGILWVGSFYGGVNKLVFPSDEFKSISTENENVTALQADANGLFIGTLTGKLRYVTKDKERTLLSLEQTAKNGITACSKSNDGALWVGTFDNGIIRLSGNTKHFYTKENGKLNNTTVSVIYKDRKHKIWAGTYGGGLSVYDEEIDGFKPVLYTDENGDIPYFIYQILEDKEDNFWVGTQNGLLLLNRDTKQFKTYPLSSESKIYALHNGKSGSLYASTSDGYVYSFNTKLDRFEEEEPLKGMNIYGILEGDDKKLWLSSPHLLYVYTKKNKQLEAFDAMDGIKTSSFNIRAQAQGADGTFYFGGKGGVTMFRPDSVRKKVRSNTLMLTDLLIYNTSVHTGQYPAVLGSHISEASVVNIPYDLKMFTVGFSDLNYKRPHLSKYVYKLEGFHNQWIETHALKPHATFTNLDHGEYNFIVKSLYTNGKQYLKIRVVPPFWLRTWFKVSFICLFLFVGYLWYRSRINRIKRRAEQLECIVAERTQALEEQKNIAVQAKNIVVKLDEMKTRFYENISHEFRTPLTLIIDPVRQMIEKKSVDFSRLSGVLESAKQVLNLINELLDLSKLDMGQITLRAKKYSLNPFLKASIEPFYSLAEVHHIKFQYIEISAHIELYFDRLKLEKIINNLLSNAFKFTEENGVVSFIVEEMEKDVRLTVSDTGKGMSEDERSTIFNRFYSDTHNEMNTGIGLALTKELVELHSGRIEVQSTLGEGSTFSVYLPKGCEHLADDQFEEDQPFNEQTKETDIRLGYTILVIEDQKDVREYIADVLGSEYKVLQSEHGKDGLHQANEDIPDLIITDVMMPEMDGITLVKELKSSEKTNHIPIIMLTARSEDEDRINGLNLHVDDYMIKPFNSEELRARINRLIKQRELLKNKYSQQLLLEPTPLDVQSVDEQFISKVKSIVEAHIEESTFSVTDFHESLAMSKKQLERKLKSVSGYTPNHFIRVMRLKRAKQLLESNAGNVSEVAFQVGFNNLSYFAKCFRDEFGLLPSEL